MKRSTVLLILLSVVAMMIATGYYLYSKDKKKPISYKTEQPFVTNIIQKTVATGAVVPRKEVEIKPQVSGLIDKLYVEAGDLVKRGDLIATIRIIPDMVTLNNAENRVNRAKLALKNAKADFDRNQELFKDGVIAEATFQQFELDYQNAQEELNAAKDNLDLIRKGSTSRSGQVSNTNVRAAISGMILDVPVEEGHSVIEANTFNEGTTIATVANMDEMIFEGNVDESEVGKIKTGMTLLLTIGALEDEQLEATLEHISPKGVVDNGAIRFQIRAAVNLKKDQFIRANYSANADIVLDRRDSVLAIPESLLIFEGKETFVEVHTGNQNFEKMPVSLGLSDGINIEVLDGIEKDTDIKNPNAIVEG